MHGRRAVSPQWPTTHLAGGRSSEQLDRINGAPAGLLSIHSADRAPRLLSTKPLLRRQQSQNNGSIFDDESYDTDHRDATAGMAGPGEKGSRENNSFEEGSNLHPNFQARGSATTVDVIENEPRQDYASTSKRHFSRILPLLSTMKEKRMSLVAKRLQVQEERELLRTTRDVTIDLAAKFMTSLNTFFATHNSPEIRKIQDDYERFRAAGDEYLPKEHDYNRLEDDVNQGEWELKELETKTYQKMERFDQMAVTEGEGQLDDSDIQSAESASTVSQQPVYPPLLHELLSRLGDVDLVKEHLVDLRSERAYLVEQQRLLASAGHQLGGPSLDFLADFDVKHEELQRQIVDLEADVDRLRNAWNQENSTSKGEQEAAGEDFISLEDATLPEPDPLLVDQVSSLEDLPKAPTEIQQVLIEKPLSPSVLPQYEELRKKACVEVLTYINEWFLWRLRQSSLEIKRYKSEPSLDKLRGQEPYLSDLILDYWFRDSAIGYLSTPTKEMIPKSNTIVTAINIGRDGMSHPGSTAKSDSCVSTMRQLTLLLRGKSSHNLQQNAGSLRKKLRRRSSAPDTAASISY